MEIGKYQQVMNGTQLQGMFLTPRSDRLIAYLGL